MIKLPSSKEFIESCKIILPFLVIGIGICLVSLKKLGADKNHDNEKGAVKKLQRLRCSVKNCDWGKIGNDSAVYWLYAANCGTNIDPNKPYAELWMGTHESGPSYVITNGKILSNLKSWIQKNPRVLGDKVYRKWGCDLPFLFKVFFLNDYSSFNSYYFDFL